MHREKKINGTRLELMRRSWYVPQNKEEPVGGAVLFFFHARSPAGELQQETLRRGAEELPEF